jgi:hypothetical protein
VKVGAEVQLPSVIRHPVLGSLLIFDATDNFTPIGDIPEEQQGSLALIVSKDTQEITRMPVIAPEGNHLERRIEAELTQAGTISARVSEQSVGQAAAYERRLFKERQRSEYVKTIERWVTTGASGARVERVEPQDDFEKNEFNLAVDFSADRYGQLMQNRLLVFKPVLVARRDSLALNKPSRKTPVVLDSHAFREVARFRLPDGFAVDEMPEDLALETAFGSYRCSFRVDEGILHFERSLILKPVTVPVEEYQQVREFFEKIRSTEQAPVVLLRR